jgi:hypothetical protein
MDRATPIQRRLVVVDDAAAAAAAAAAAQSSSTFFKGFSIHRNSNDGLIAAMTFPRISASGTGPKYRESLDATKLSPTIQQWPGGTWSSSLPFC